MSGNYGFTLPAHSRVWVYQAERFFNETELDTVQRTAADFLKSWNSHGMDLSAEIKVIDQLFIVVAVDEQKAKASGCSIDKSVKFIRDLESVLQQSLTGRTTVAYIENQEIKLKDFKVLVEEIKSGKVNDSCIMYNNLITTLDELNTKWKVAMKESWLSIIPV